MAFRRAELQRPGDVGGVHAHGLCGPEVEWVGRHPDEARAERYGPDYEGWYSRGIGGGAEHMKILLGGV